MIKKRCNNKRGLSEVVTTLITILLVMVAIGIVWVVVQNIMKGGVGQVTTQSTCLAFDVKVTSVDCTNPAACRVTINRKSGGEEIGGVKLVFKNETDASSVKDVPGNIEVLGTINPVQDSGLTAPNSAELTVYIIDEAGREQICPTSTSFEF